MATLDQSSIQPYQRLPSNPSVHKTETELGQLKEESKTLDEEIAELEREVEHIEAIIADEERYKSASRDARKMYGDITPGDTTHQDVILLYQNHFKNAFRNMPRALKEKEPNKFKIWKMCADIVQESFEANKASIIKKMNEGLRDALDLEKDSVGPLTEDKRDLHRAFKLLLEEKGRKNIKEKILNDLKTHKPQSDMSDKDVKEMCDFVIDMMFELEPADYKSFLTSGKPRDRIKDCKLPSKRGDDCVHV